MLNNRYYQICKKINDAKKQEKEMPTWQIALIALPIGLAFWLFDICFCVILGGK